MMKHFLAAMLAMACIAAYTPSFAAGAHGIGRGSVGIGRGIGHGPGRFRVPNMTNRIPQALPSPAQPPVINGPLSPSGLPPMGNGLR
jgi:hypothetical protein